MRQKIGPTQAGVLCHKSFYGDKAMSKEEILTAIQGLAEKLGRVPTLTEMKTMTPVGRRAVRSHFRTYTNALIAVRNVETGRRFRIPNGIPVCRLGEGGTGDAKDTQRHGI